MQNDSESCRMRFEPGQRIGSYRVIRLLGQGGMGAVYEVEHEHLGVHYAMKTFTLEEGNQLIGNTIIDSNIRDKASCIVMGIKRGNDYIMNPEPQVVFEQDDVVIVAGETERLKQFINSYNP